MNATDGSPITGVAEAGSFVTIKDALGAVMGTGTADAVTGAYSIVPSVVLVDGAVLSVTATDAAGNVSPVAMTTVDATAPALPTINATDGSSITGVAEAGSVVTLKDAAGVLIGTATADALTGAYSIVPSVVLVDGALLSVTATDAAGNVSPVATATVNAAGDITPPIVPIINATDGSPITGVAEAGSFVTIKDALGAVIGTGTADAVTGAYSIIPSTVPADGAVLSVIATDAAGNVSPVATTTVDATVPALPTINATDGSPIAGVAEAGSFVTIKDALGAVIGTGTADAVTGAYSIVPSTVPVDGAVLSVTATDAAGNVSSVATTIVDATAPTSIVSAIGDTSKTAAEATHAAGVVTVNGETGSTSVLTLVGVNGTVTKTIANDGTALPVVLSAADLTILGDGAVEVTTITTDVAGNAITTADVSDGDFVLDTVAPMPVISAIGDVAKTAAEATDAAGVVTVTGETGSTSVVTFVGVNGTVTKTITNDGTALPVVLSAADLTTLGDGAVEVTTVTTDAAGNPTTTADVSDGDFVLDTAAPTPTVTAIGDAAKTVAEATDAAGIVTVNGETGSTAVVTFVGVNGTVTKTIANDGTALPVVLTAADLATLGDGAVEVTTVTTDAAGNPTTTADVSDGDFILDIIAPIVTAPVVSYTDNNIPADQIDLIVQTFGSGTGRASFASAGVIATTSYIYSAGAVPDGDYTLSNTVSGLETWWASANVTVPAAQDLAFRDHTGDVNGRFLAVNASAAPGEFYRQPITVSDAGDYKVAAFLASANNAPINANVTIKIVDSLGNIVASIDTGDLPDYTNAASAWREYSLMANLPAGSYNFVLVNNAPGGSGNDIFIDDISFSYMGVNAISGITSTAAVTNDTSPVINGALTTALDSGDIVNVYRDGVKVGTATVSGNAWTFADSGLIDGTTYIYTAKVADPAGNETVTGTAFTMTIDTTAPTATASVTGYADNVGGVTSTASTAPTTDDTSPVINGTLSAPLAVGEVVNVYRGTTLIGTATVNGLTWTYADSGLANSTTYAYKARVADAAGNISATSVALNITIDTTTPGIDVTPPTIIGFSSATVDGTYGDGSIINITATASEPVAAGSSIDILLDTGDIVHLVAAADGTTMIGDYIVSPGDTSTDLKVLSYTAGTVAAPSVHDLAGNAMTSTAMPVASANIDAAQAIVVDSPIQAPATLALMGDRLDDHLGWDVANIGDFNNDGISDFAISAPQWDINPNLFGAYDAGAVYIVYGNQTGLPNVGDMQNLTVAQGFRLTGHDASNLLYGGDAIGEIINPLGDINGDGYADLGIGAKNTDTAYVLLGGNAATFSATTYDIESVNGNIFSIAGGGAFGYSVSGADVNNDGYSDILIGAPLVDNSILDWDRGRAYIMYGHAGAATDVNFTDVTLTSNTFTNQTLSSVLSASNDLPLFADANDASIANPYRLGDSISNVGDVNGDGINDFVVTAPTSDNAMSGTGNAGSAWLVYGQQGKYTFNVDLSNLTLAQGVQINAYGGELLGGEGSGHNLTTALGDINGDGVGDFAISAPSSAATGSDGQVWVIYGRNGGLTHDINLNVNAPFLSTSLGYDSGVNPFTAADGFLLRSELEFLTSSNLGVSIRGGQDINGDGIDDFVVSDPTQNQTWEGDAGSVYVVYGQDGGFGSNDITLPNLLANSQQAVEIKGLTGGDTLGSGVALGDWNGDGLSEIAIGQANGDSSNGFLVNDDIGGAFIMPSISQLTQAVIATANTITAINGSPDRVSGGAGNDTINSVSTKDVAYGGSGADVINIISNDFTRVDGGLGIDTLTVASPSAMVLDLAALGSKVQNFEKFDLGVADGVGHTINLRLSDVLNETTNTVLGHMEVTGGAVDTVNLNGTGNWITSSPVTASGITFDIYHNNLLDAANTLGDVWIQQGVNVAYTPDTSAPLVLNFSSTTADGSYAAGSSINITATMTESVKAGSSIDVTLNTGDLIHLVAAADGTALVGTYTVGLGDAAADLKVISYTAGTFAAPAVHDLAGNAMTNMAMPVANANIDAVQAIVVAAPIAEPAVDTLKGDNGGDNLGRDVSNVGDFNGDGIADFAVSAPNYDATSGFFGGNNEGGVYVVYGTTAGIPVIGDIGSMAITQGLKITGASPGDVIGKMINAVGDVNGDGFADLVIGATAVNKAYVVLGSNIAYITGSVSLGAVLGTTTSNNIFAITASSNIEAGYSVSGVDVNNDGYSDILFGAPVAGSGAGAGYVMYGHGGAITNVTFPDITLSTISGEANTFANGTIGTKLLPSHDLNLLGLSNDQANSGRLGEATSNVGDVNGDGIDDFIFTASTSTNALSPLLAGGSAWLVYGQQGGFGASLDLNNLTLAQGVQLNGYLGENLGGNAGRNVTTALGDINGDGIGDFAIAAAQHNHVWVVYGVNGGHANNINLDTNTLTAADGFVLNSEFDLGGSQLGASIRGGQDINGDGLDDFVVSAPNQDLGLAIDAGAAYVIYGQKGGFGSNSVDLSALLTSSQQAIKISGQGRLGSGVAVGDWNGDGVADIGIGRESEYFFGDGSAYVLPGTSQLTQTGDSGNNIIAAVTKSEERISGAQGNDTINNVSTLDVAYGGAGDDLISIASNDFTRVDGGLGVDTLSLAGAPAMTLNFSSLGSKVQGFEKFDLGAADGVGHTLKLRLSDVLNETNASTLGHMQVTGGATDTVNLSGTWATSSTATASGVTFDVYHNSALAAGNTLGDVWVQQGVVVVSTNGLDTTAPLAPVATVAANGATVTGTAEAGSTVTIKNAANTILGTTVAALDGSYSVPLSPALTNGEALTATATDAANNVSPVASAMAPDTTAPTASVTTATIDTVTNAVVQSTEVGTAYLVKDTVTVTNLASITSAADNVWNQVPISTANSNTNLVATGLLDGTYKVYTVDAAGNLSAASTNSITVADTALHLGPVAGVNLNLIAPVTMADGKVYYHLDQSGDGVFSGSDHVDHDLLDALLNGGADTINTQLSGAVAGVDDERTIIVGGYTLVLPTVAELTALYNDPAPNPPVGWDNINHYWSATLYSPTAHYNELLTTGQVNGYADGNGFSVTFQVIANPVVANPLTFTSMSIDLATASDNGVSTTDNITSNTAPTINGTVTGLSATVAAAATAGTVTANLFDDKNDNGLYDAGDSLLAVNIPLSVTGTNATFTAQPTLLGGTYNTKAILIDQANNASVAGLLDNSGTAQVVVDWTAAPSVVAGNQANDGLGYAMANAGDFNGDGYADFILTAPHDQSSSFDIGVRKSDMYIVYGSATGLTNVGDIDTMTAAQGIHITSTAIVGADIALQGLVTSGIGDLNGDGYADVAIGSHRDDSLYVVFGRGGNSTATFDLRSIETGATTNGFHIANWATGAWMATGLGGGDVNGDGYGDLMFGSSDGLGNGLAYTLYGHAGASGDASWSNLYATATEGLHVKGTLGVYGAPLDAGAYTTLSTTYDPTGQAHDFDSDLGDRVTVISDVNGDGYNDYIVTAPRADTTTSFDAGSAYLLFGSASGLGSGFDLGNLSPSQGVRLNGTENYEYLGGSTLLAGGIGDHGDALWGQGASVSNIGDINADGVADFAIGSPTWGDQVADGQAAGRVYVLYGKGIGANWADVDLANLNGSNGFIINSTALGSTSSIIANSQDAQLGFSISNGGDVNGDGVDDFIISAPGADNGATTDTGAAYLVYGQAGGTSFTAITNLDSLVSSGKAIKYSGINTKDFAGTGLATGDWDGDGIADVTYSVWESDTATIDNGGSYVVYKGGLSNLTQSFTTGNDSLTAGTNSGGATIVNGVDRISGGLGNDSITGIGTDTTGTTATTTLHDVAYGGQGNDHIALAGTNFTRVDGGLGIDTLGLTGATALSLDLTPYNTRVKGFEKFDLGASDSVGHTLSMRLADVLNEPGTNALGHIEVVGGAGDKVDLSGEGSWTTATTQAASGVTYNVYHNSALDAANTKGDVWVQQGVTVNGTNTSASDNNVPLAGTAVLPVTLSVSSTSSSTQINDGLGFAMSDAGDFNGDGYTDYIVSAPHNQIGGLAVAAGNMYIVYGSQTGLPTLSNIDSMTASQGIKLASNSLYADGYQGMVVTSIGDLNGDGFADVAIGSILNDSLYVVFGRGGNTTSALQLTDLDNVATADGFRIRNWDTGAWFASGLSGGDVNNDGYSDLMFGSSDGLGNGMYFTLYGHTGAAGAANWGNILAETTSLNTSTNSQLPGDELNRSAYTAVKTTYISQTQATVHDLDSDLGDRIKIVGDVNGDGFNDYVVTAPRAEATASTFDAGRAYLMFGTEAGLGKGFDLNDLSPTQGIRINGTENYEDLGGSTLFAGGNDDNADAYYGMGSSVNSIGDINGDGITDFAIGSPEWGDQVADAQSTGRTYIVYGKGAGMDWSDINLASLGSQGFIMQGSITDVSNGFNFNTTHHDQLGFSVSNGGDVNGDGIDDFLIGAPGETAGALKDYAGAAYLVFGQAGGTGFLSTTGLDVLVTANKAIRFAGVNADDYTGTGVTIGDWNGDGIADVSYGTWENGATNTGSYQVYNGATSNLTQTFTLGNDTLAAGTHNGSGPVLVAGVDRISGGQGNDTLTGIGTDTTGTMDTTSLHDVAYGGAGDDNISLAGMSFTRVDGGLGIDTLTLAGTSSLSLNIAEYGNRVKGFEKFDLGSSDGIGHNLSLRLSDVLNETNSSVLGHMQVTGGAGDSVQLNGSGTWTTATTATATGITFDVYHNTNLDAANKLGDVWIQQGMAVL
ncbi:Ig-like domain-containing protein [Crenothrix polyspora]|nr:Ig-like domain-containing protein [Crenothrix polyspora]